MNTSSYPVAGQSLDKTPDIDFRSDTVTKPSTAMRQFMSEAAVGDDVYGEDPSINALQLKVATLLNKEAALFVPSGTMSNLLALMSHCQRGEEIIIGDQYHICSHEAGGASVLGSIVMQSINTSAKGYITAGQVAAAIRPDDAHFAKSKLVCLENTVSGFVQPQAELEAITILARENNLKVHMDGARLMHAAIKTDCSPADLCKNVDSVSLCLSKGLGAPAGSVLSGSSSFIAGASRLRKMLGGGMRQAGILAAAGIYALDNNVQRLQQDHQLAYYFATELNKIAPLSVDLASVETNMLFVNFPLAQGKTAEQSLAKFLINSGICLGDTAPCRIVVHLDISRQDVDKTLAAITEYYRER
ncbi:MAG: low-specificity L-threonine aldolase [Pseudomonadales bacterium]|nr:low-specificity L-threonine aldolase [Pseudomonadales bacterium]